MASYLDLFDKKSIKPSSKALYAQKLLFLNDAKPIHDLEFLIDVKQVLHRISHFAPSTQRSYIIAIISLLKEVEGANATDLYNEYYELLEHFNKQLATNNSKTKKEIDNWTNQDEIKEKFNELLTILAAIKGKHIIKQCEFNALLNLVILSLYVLLPPRRNLDYSCMMLGDGTDKAFNYLVPSKSKKHPNWIMKFNNYKTAGTYETQTIIVPDALKEILKVFLKFIPKNGFLLVDYDGVKLKGVNAITLILNKIFCKRVGVGMLRKSYLTEKYSNFANDMKKDADAMGTSIEMVQNQYLKND